VPRCIKGEGSLDNNAPGHLIEKIFARTLIRTRVRGKHDRFPTECGQMLNKSQGALDTATARHRREMVRDHQDSLRHCPPAKERLNQSSVIASISCLQAAVEKVWSASGNS
jgi:hypothetical protein